MRASARSLVVMLSLVVGGPAVAGKKHRNMKPAPGTAADQAAHDKTVGEAEAQAAPGTVPAIEHGEGSLWDFIEQADGEVPEAQAIEESEELDEERQAEAAFIATEATDIERTTTDTGFYTDPAAVLGPALPDPADDPLFLSLVDPAEFDIPVEINDSVVKWMKYFTGSGRKHYARWLARSTRVRPLMYARLDAAGAPRDLVYLSMIESGYSTHAYSRAAAVGLWQFISSTGRMYDLRVDWWVDERRDPYAATDAAIHFLTDLEKRHGHWYLAWAGYNGGPARVSRGVRNHGTTDFWTLVDKNAFPAETDNYVPKIIAAAIIGHHPERYGFTGIEFQEPVALEPVDVGPNISLDVLAKCAGVSVEDMQHANPHLRRFATPPSPDTTRIYVPQGQRTGFLAALAEVPPEERISFQRHKVAKGETLGRIAQKYGVTVRELQDVNRISNPNRIYVGMELVVPVQGMPTGAAVALASSAGGSAASSTPRSTKVTHVVQRGQTLSTIAARYGVSTSDLKRWNKISNANKIYVGQRLSLVQAQSQWTRYTVRKGDNLTAIARKQGCSVEELKSWNNLKTERIYPGQNLKVRKR